MKFTVEIDGQREELEVVRQRAAGGDTAGDGGDVLRITRDGQAVEVRVVHQDGPEFVLEIVEEQGDRLLRRRVRAAGHSDGDRRQLWVNGRHLSYTVMPEGEQRPAGSDQAAGSLSSSIPAVVSEVLVAVGDEVKAGQKLILLESMKMILPIQAPHDGVVQAVHCEVGEAVGMGVVLVEIGG